MSIAEQVSWLVNFLFFRFCAVEELEESHEDTGFGFDRNITSEKNQEITPIHIFCNESIILSKIMIDNRDFLFQDLLTSV